MFFSYLLKIIWIYLVLFLWTNCRKCIMSGQFWTSKEGEHPLVLHSANTSMAIIYTCGPLQCVTSQTYNIINELNILGHSQLVILCEQPYSFWLIPSGVATVEHVLHIELACVFKVILNGWVGPCLVGWHLSLQDPNPELYPCATRPQLSCYLNKKHYMGLIFRCIWKV